MNGKISSIKAEQVVLSATGRALTIYGSNPFYRVVYVSRRASSIIVGNDNHQWEFDNLDEVEFLEVTHKHGNVTAFVQDETGEFNWHTGTDY